MAPNELKEPFRHAPSLRTRVTLACVCTMSVGKRSSKSTVPSAETLLLPLHPTTRRADTAHPPRVPCPLPTLDQVFFGLDKFLPYFDFIGDFKHVQAHSEALLRRAGLWEEFGASGWGPEGKAAFFQR